MLTVAETQSKIENAANQLQVAATLTRVPTPTQKAAFASATIDLQKVETEFAIKMKSCPSS